VFLIWWIFTVEILSFLAFPILFLVLPKFKDRGWGLSKVFGILFFSFLIWILASVNIISFNYFWTLIIFLLLAAVGISAFCLRRKAVTKFLKQDKKLIIVEEAVFLGLFGLFALLRSLNPEIYWGEKPMDFTILNSLLRAEHFPPYEAWLSGAVLNYYYFGSFTIAALTKLTIIPANFTYNLGLATTQALIFIAVFSLILNITKKFSWGFLAASLAALLGNFEAIAQLLRGRALDFGFFWDTTRIIPSGIEEYPIWSFLFGDLHAHYLALPYLVLPIAFIYGISQGFPKVFSKNQLALYLLFSLSLGVMFITNSWNWPTLAMFAVLFGLVSTFVYSCETKLYQPLKFALSFLAVILAAGASLVFVFPFFLAAPQKPQGMNWEENAAVNLGQIFSIWGIFLIPIIGYLFYEFYQKYLKQINFKRIVPIILVIGTLVFLIVNNFWPIEKRLQNPVNALFLFLAVLILISLISSVLRKEKELLLPKSLLVVVMAALLFSQFFFFADKMNTIFKIYVQSWIFLAVISVLLVASLWPAVLKFKKTARLIIYPTAILLLTISGITTLTDVVINSTTTHVPVDIKKLPRPTLDGTAYLKLKDADLAKALEFLNRMKGTPVIVEAYKTAYGDYTRISMNTGLPTVVGWEHHLKQRGNDPLEIEKRKNDLKDIYESRDKNKVRELLRKYAVKYIYLGKLEQETYQTSLSNFEGLAKVIFESGGEKILEVQ